jgi:predicted HD superfamily hydrolase involved in NAD metabolism
MTRDEAEEIAASYLGAERLEHSLSVARLAEIMGISFGLDGDALYIAGALHDIAKRMKHGQQRELALAWHDLHPGHPWSETQALWHAPAAAWLAWSRHGLTDDKILQAIVRHTTGCQGMTRFDDCLYAADFLDPVRVFDEQDDVWPLVERDFDAGLLEMCRGAIESVVKRRRVLDQASVAYYNELLSRLADPTHSPHPFPRLTAEDLRQRGRE